MKKSSTDYLLHCQMHCNHETFIRVSRSSVSPHPSQHIRSLSVNSAINHSLRKSQRKPGKLAPTATKQDDKLERRFDRTGGSSLGDARRSREQRDVAPPLTIPYTTSASEFLYGTSVVKAALEAKRRKLYKLYNYAGDNRESLEQDLVIRKLALRSEVVVERLKGNGLRLMDRMSGGRPHNVSAACVGPDHG